MDEELFHQLAEEIERNYQMGGLSGGLYEDYAHDILVRYLAVQQVNQSDTTEVRNLESLADQTSATASGSWAR